MNKKTYKVPIGITKLSQWKEFGDIFPEGKFILNKQITGCGATTYFLDVANRTPIILCSHRSELLTCKKNSPRHEKYVHLFKDPTDKTGKQLAENMKRLREYLADYTVNPFTGEIGMVPKILVTTDSLGHVIDVLKDLQILQDFMVVSDEMQCIFTDASFKGDSVLNYLVDLEDVKRVCFLSATPYIEEYLDKLDEFKNLPYIELKWDDSMVDDIVTRTINVRDLKAAAIDKIEFYKANGYFEKLDETGETATQAVFFMNSVSDIVSIIKKTGLTPDDTNVICSKSNSSNKTKLSKVGFKIGESQKEGEPHATFTFVTKCSFEGVDFYHTNAYTYIFSDPNKKHMAMDLSIDLPQILGRQRLAVNKWRTFSTVFFYITKESLEDDKKTPEQKEKEFEMFQDEKEKFTNRYLHQINDETDPFVKRGFINVILKSNKVIPFEENYVSIVTDKDTGEARARVNILVKTAEKRAWEIKKKMYTDKYQVLAVVAGQGFKISGGDQILLEHFFDNNKDFVDRMKEYCNFREKHPEGIDIKRSLSIPSKFNYYYDEFGPEIIKYCGYQETKILAFKGTQRPENIPTLKDKIYSVFNGVTKMSKLEIKQSLQKIYNEFNIKKVAKATDLDEYYITSITSMVINGKKINGFKIISQKQ